MIALTIERSRASVVENEASNKLALKLGFTLEGTRRRGGRPISTGKYHDKNDYGLLKSEWNSHRK